MFGNMKIHFRDSYNGEKSEIKFNPNPKPYNELSNSLTLLKSKSKNIRNLQIKSKYNKMRKQGIKPKPKIPKILKTLFKYKNKNTNKSMTYYERNKEKRKEYQKEYALCNPEKIKAKTKKYKEEHYERLKLEKAIKIVCSCKRVILKRGYNRHLESKIHYKFLKEQDVSNISLLSEKELKDII